MLDQLMQAPRRGEFNNASLTTMACLVCNNAVEGFERFLCRPACTLLQQCTLIQRLLEAVLARLYSPVLPFIESTSRIHGHMVFGVTARP